jgi:HSP20 family protein
MATIKRNPFIFPSLANEIFRPDWFGGTEGANGTVPAVNIIENEKDFGLELMVPGRKKEDFKLELDKDILTVSYEAKTADQTEGDNYTRREFVFSSFKRSFSLPNTIDVENINAFYGDGILKLTLPKKAEALPKPKRLIEIA